MDQKIPQLSQIRHSNLLCTQVDKIKCAQQSLEDNAEKLTVMVYQIPEGAQSTYQEGNRMSEQEMKDDIDLSVQQCQQKAETMNSTYKTVVVKAKKIPQEQAACRHLQKRQVKQMWRNYRWSFGVNQNFTHNLL